MSGVSLHFQVAFCGFDAGVFRALCFQIDGSVMCCCEWSERGLFSYGTHGVSIVDSFQWYLYSI